MPTPTRLRNAPGSLRRGAALIEFALVLPIILLLVTALLEVSRVQMLKHTADTAAYEGARCAIVVGAQPEVAVAAAEDLLRAAKLNLWEIEVQPTTIDERTPTITVQVDIPVAGNSWISPFFFSSKTVTSSVTLITERPAVVQLTGIPRLQDGILGINALGLGL